MLLFLPTVVPCNRNLVDVRNANVAVFQKTMSKRVLVGSPWRQEFALYVEPDGVLSQRKTDTKTVAETPKLNKCFTFGREDIDHPPPSVARESNRRP